MSILSTQDAEAIAISGLHYLAAQEELLLRFCDLSGLTVSGLRQAASEPGFLPGILDFFLSHEPDLLAWAQSDAINPEQIATARRVLAVDQQTDIS